MLLYPLKNHSKQNQLYAWSVELQVNEQEKLVDLPRGRPIALYVKDDELLFEPIGNNILSLCKRINGEGIKASYNLFHGTVEMDNDWPRLWKVLPEIHLEEKGGAGGRELYRVSAKYKRQP